MKVLVLDDHKAFRDEVMKMLRRNGHEAEDAATPEEAIPRVETGNYDIVLVDYQMPGHNGLWFMKHVDLPPSTKALLVTAHTQRQMINEMFKNGASGYIIKPFDEEDLMHNLAFHCER